MESLVEENMAKAASQPEPKNHQWKPQKPIFVTLEDIVVIPNYEGGKGQEDVLY